MRNRIQLLSMVAISSFFAIVVTVGCGESAPPPAPPVEVTPSPEYNAGEAAYQKQK